MKAKQRRHLRVASLFVGLVKSVARRVDWRVWCLLFALLLLLAVAVGCCCWLLLLAVAVGCCCWLLLLLLLLLLLIEYGDGAKRCPAFGAVA
ncbi:hypothetical protein VC273_20805 [Xanthomonas nasturtii]|uniref:hypothetical protein n=1 Tax=Xanthomonas nasturtii TaxID=1843581 RepID=UPI002B224FE3|nr:hypothetical protein [Xanthomonas nasturtii]MEA9558242.1 hypothetical protein [Xanthomonas nasturtii]